jgi:hypothetical protein
MLLRDKTQRLFEYISQVYAIDLPINRDVRKYGNELWWQSDIISSAQCKIKNFIESTNAISDEQSDELADEKWLSVTKRSYDEPPQLPSIIREWVDLSPIPSKIPAPKPSIPKVISFDSDSRRTDAFKRYAESLRIWKAAGKGKTTPPIPESLRGWIDLSQLAKPPFNLASFDKREIIQQFEDDKNRVEALKNYIEGPWILWSERVLPLFKANMLYDQLFSLYQRLSVEGDRIEIVWGHLFLSWHHSADNDIYHPLVVTPMNLHFEPIHRTISLAPSQTISTKLDLDCLTNLDYPSKDKLIKYARIVNAGEPVVDSGDMSLDAWNHTQMRWCSATITGFLSNESADKSNLYVANDMLRPPTTDYPAIYNAPVIFIRERTRRLWVDDAKKVAEAVQNGSEIPPFIGSLTADPQTSELPNPDDYKDYTGKDEDEGEHLLPLLYNDQQEEIVKKLKGHYGVLVQGPPGTGKSHTIANIVSSLLARGKRVLVTSQTENALKVLRDYIPPEIRSLCVSQLGNDTESKRQLGEAVESIGNHMSEKDSSAVEQKIQQLKEELRMLREEQAQLRNKIKDWVKIDSWHVQIGEEIVSAYAAARYCAENVSEHAWFPDSLSPETEPPSNNEELIEMCSLVKELSPADRKAWGQYLPDPTNLLQPKDFAEKISELKALVELLVESENLRDHWDERINKTEQQDVKKIISILEAALSEFEKMKDSWQFKILELITTEKNQHDYWQNVLQMCENYRNSAWQSYQLIQDCQIEIGGLSPDLEVNAALEELDRLISKGRKPTGLIAKLTLSKAAKEVFRKVKVDGRQLLTSERVKVAKAHCSYTSQITKIYTVWEKTIGAVDGCVLDRGNLMPLAEIDEKIKWLRYPLQWKNGHYRTLESVLTHAGCQEQAFYTHEVLVSALKVLKSRQAEIAQQAIEEKLSEYASFLANESKKENAHVLWQMLSEAVRRRSLVEYVQAYDESVRLLRVGKKVRRLEKLAGRLSNVAPKWCDSLFEKALEIGSNALEKDWLLAWKWRRLDEWLSSLHNRESVESLQNKLERARKKESALLVHLVKERTWQRQLANVKEYHYRSLTTWANAMRLYGKGTGKNAQRYLLAATKAMADAVGAVPAWVMPLHRVVQSFPAEPGVFDVIIVDESSQCDLRALPVLFRGKKVLVVGDPEQISPSHVGIERDKVFQLNRHYLSDIPNSDITFVIDNSLYNITEVMGISRTLLTEHFRCVPHIIGFNNHLCPSYAGKLEPLRQPNPQEMLEPAIVTKFVEKGFKDNNDVNRPEAEVLVEELMNCCKNDLYSSGGKDNRKRTMGVISLLGEKQAKYISELIAERLDETERAERRIICGDAYAFQGDERDVMFLSLVVAPNAPFASLVRDADRQRFNVATSRARDQVHLFHSARLDDIKNPSCVRYKLLSWYLNPPIAEMTAGIEILKKRAESEFEIEVGGRIISRGYKVIPQFCPFPSDFNYRIDLVVQGDTTRVAVECDGDRWHGSDSWEYDQRREAQLRRAGWKFWRISGSFFYRNKGKSLDALWKFLEEEGVNPISLKTEGDYPRTANQEKE